MKPNFVIRIILALLLAIAGIVILYNLTGVIGEIASDGLAQPLLILTIIGSILITIFVLLSIVDLLRNKTIAKPAYIISLIFAVVVCAMLALFGYGLIQDMLGLTCDGFFGEQTTCTLGPLLILYVVVLIPIPIFIAGLLATYGTYVQLKFRKLLK